jgi:tetratricopeptide (TPR) repeat protein
MPGYASSVYCTLGSAYQSLGNFFASVEYHKKHLTLPKEVDDRAGNGRAYGNLGRAYQSLGKFSKAIKYHEQMRVTGRGRAGSTGTSATHQSQRAFSKAIKDQQQHLIREPEVPAQEPRACLSGAAAGPLHPGRPPPWQSPGTRGSRRPCQSFANEQ